MENGPNWDWYEKIGLKNLDGFKDCHRMLLDLVERHNRYFKKLGEMDPDRIAYDAKENPRKLLKELKEIHDFFNSGKWELERYKNNTEVIPRKLQEKMLLKYLEDFYIDFYPKLELAFISNIDELEGGLCAEELIRNYSRKNRRESACQPYEINFMTWVTGLIKSVWPRW